MGLFDSKKTKQERELYQTLLKESKNCWNLARDIGKYTEKEFLKPSSQDLAKLKQDIIDKYKLVMEIIKNNDLKTLKMNSQKDFLPTKTVYEYFQSRYDLTTFNGCYSLLCDNTSWRIYEYFKNHNNGSIIDFLQSYAEISDAFLADQSKKESDNFQAQIKKGEEKLDRELAQLSRLERAFGIDNSYSSLTQAEFDAMAISERDRLVQDLNKNMEDINSNKGRRGR